MHDSDTILDARATLALSFRRAEVEEAYYILASQGEPNLETRYTRALDRCTKCEQAQAERVARGLSNRLEG
jgi:hypothetical protein